MHERGREVSGYQGDAFTGSCVSCFQATAIKRNLDTLLRKTCSTCCWLRILTLVLAMLPLDGWSITLRRASFLPTFPFHKPARCGSFADNGCLTSFMRDSNLGSGNHVRSADPNQAKVPSLSGRHQTGVFTGTVVLAPQLNDSRTGEGGTKHVTRDSHSNVSHDDIPGNRPDETIFSGNEWEGYACLKIFNPTRHRLPVTSERQSIHTTEIPPCRRLM